MKTFRKFKITFALAALTFVFVGISATQSKANMFGAYTADLTYQNSQPLDIQQAKWLKVAAFVVGFVAGVGAGLTEGWAACGVLVDALDGIEKAGAFHNLNYNPTDLSGFDLIK